MATSRYTNRPAVVRHEFRWRDEDLWIDLKGELNTGERNRIRFSGIRIRDGEAAAVDFEQAIFEKTRTWIAAWSLKDDAGQPLPHGDIDVLRALKADLYDLIDDAVTAHAQTVEAASKKASAPLSQTSDAGRQSLISAS